MDQFTFVLFYFVLYFLPYLVAYSRGHNNTAPILVVNLFLGWTVLGWIAALAWSVSNNTDSENKSGS